MTDGMLQVQLLVPALKIDATLSSTLNKAEGLTLQLKSDIKLPEMVSVQAVTFKYGILVKPYSQSWVNKVLD